MALLDYLKNYANNSFDISFSGHTIKIILVSTATCFLGVLYFLRRRKPVKEDPQLDKLSLPPGPKDSFILAGFDFGMNHVAKI